MDGGLTGSLQVFSLMKTDQDQDQDQDEDQDPDEDQDQSVMRMELCVRSVVWQRRRNCKSRDV